MVFALGKNSGPGYDSGTNKNEEKFPYVPGENFDARIARMIARASSKADPTSWVIVLQRGSPTTQYYLKQCRNAKERKLRPQKGTRALCSVYAIVEEPNHTSLKEAQAILHALGVPEIDSEESKLEDFIEKYHGRH